MNIYRQLLLASIKDFNSISSQIIFLPMYRPEFGIVTLPEKEITGGDVLGRSLNSSYLVEDFRTTFDLEAEACLDNPAFRGFLDSAARSE